jgi:hypothetical protein
MSAPPLPLLVTLQRIIERSYGMETGIREVGRFVLGDAGYRMLYASVRTLQKVSSARASALGGDEALGPRLLLRDEPERGDLRAAVYYPDELIRRLEARPPTKGLDDENIDDFAAFVEELDHLLCVADRVRAGRPFSLLELELHANVTKYLLAAMLLSDVRRARSLTPGQRVWLRFHLFEKLDFADEDPEIRSRYRDAATYARRFIGQLEATPAEARPAALRRFHALTPHHVLSRLS